VNTTLKTYNIFPQLKPNQKGLTMSLLSTLTSDTSIATEKDSLGAGAAPLESGLYPCIVTMAYLNKAASGALGLVINMRAPDNHDVRQTLWMTSGTAKGAKNYYEKDGEKHFLPGFNHANSLCLLTTDKEVSAMDTEIKVVKVYSPEAKAEVPTKVEVLMDLLGKEILVGLIKQKVDKTVKNDAGFYMPTGETRDENEIDKLFRAADRMTTAEIRAKAEEADFVNTWEAKWAGKTKDKSKGVTTGSGNSGVAGLPTVSSMGSSSTGTKKPVTSLFG